MAIGGLEPGLLQAVGNHHRHAPVDWRHQGIGGGGEHAAAVELAAIGADPALPETGKPKQITIAAPQPLALLPKSISRNQTTAMAPGGAKAGLEGHRLSAGMQAAVGGGGILDPVGQQPPKG